MSDLYAWLEDGRTELARIEAAFMRHEDGLGYLTKEGFKLASIELYGHEPDDPYVDAVFETYGDTGMTLHRWQRFASRATQRQDKNEVLLTLFKMYDIDRSGYISRLNFRAVIHELLPVMDETLIDSVYDALCPATGPITLEQFKYLVRLAVDNEEEEKARLQRFAKYERQFPRTEPINPDHIMPTKQPPLSVGDESVGPRQRELPKELPELPLASPSPTNDPLFEATEEEEKDQKTTAYSLPPLEWVE